MTDFGDFIAHGVITQSPGVRWRFDTGGLGHHVPGAGSGHPQVQGSGEDRPVQPGRGSGLHAEILLQMRRKGNGNTRRAEGGGRMTVYIGKIATFPHVKPDKAQVVKIGEECMEVFSAWENWQNTHDYELLPHLVDEIADVIQATANLLAALGVDDMREAMKACEARNRERGRYE